MQSDVTQIKRSGESVTMPLSLYEELRAFCRRHGESDLPGFAEFEVVGVEVEAEAEEYVNPLATKYHK